MEWIGIVRVRVIPIHAKEGKASLVFHVVQDSLHASLLWCSYGAPPPPPPLYEGKETIDPWVVFSLSSCTCTFS